MNERKSLRACFLFQKSGAELPPERRIWYTIWNWGWSVVAGLLVGLLSLLLAYGTRDSAVFGGYFSHPLILLLNLAAPLLLMLLLYTATGRAWIAYLVTAIVFTVPSIVNFYMLLFRDDPFTVSDLFLVREGLTILSNYTITVGARVIVCVAVIPLLTVALALFVRGKPAKLPRLGVLAAALLCMIPLGFACASETIYNDYTWNYDALAEKNRTDNFIGKGFVYPFLHSFNELSRRGATNEAADEVLNIAPSKPQESPDGETPPEPETVTYTTADIPDDQKVDVIMIMLEAFSDLTEEIDGISDEVYRDFHALQAESWSGDLVTNIFAAGTVNTERCVLTGDFWVPDDYSDNCESYVRYFERQGYTVSGSHPIYGWFYNRENVNKYLGFQSFLFWEAHYETMVKEISDWLYRDDLFLEDVYRLYAASYPLGEGPNQPEPEPELPEEPSYTPPPTPVEIPTDTPTEPPLEEPIDPPMEDDLPPELPVEEPTDTPIEEPTDEPTEEPVEPTIDEPTDTPTEVPVDAPELETSPNLAVWDALFPSATAAELDEAAAETAADPDSVPTPEPVTEHKPYFGFHVTYQGHAMYSDHNLDWGTEYYSNEDGHLSEQAYYILNNYLSSIASTVRQLNALVEKLRASEEPVVLVLFGDHKPWLGDGNSVYRELGINIDTDTEDGFYSYYTTPYLIWANDAARERLGSDFTGEGPSISPAYLMNELFAQCGWDGPAYLQLLADVEQTLPVVNTNGYYVEYGIYTHEPDRLGKRLVSMLEQVNSYRRTHLGDSNLVVEAWK